MKNVFLGLFLILSLLGAMNSDYRGLFTAASTIVGNYTATGVSNSIIAARVSYVFDLRGPSVTVDTACSSALVSIHLGAQAIRSGKTGPTIHES